MAIDYPESDGLLSKPSLYEALCKTCHIGPHMYIMKRGRSYKHGGMGRLRSVALAYSYPTGTA